MESTMVSNAADIVASVEKNTETLACLIIDDPLLKPSYGCIDFTELLRVMKIHNFFTEIAFIPWNYKRSDPSTVKLFADNPDYFALCIHGCNHTRNEFGQNNYDTLKELSQTALWRMEQHKKLTGLPYDPVIVFPQGLFTSTAMKVLKELGYLAAFNSDLKALDLVEPIPEKEYLTPATLMYHDFPLFLRHYPDHKSKFQEDIKNGRPIVIVEHHTAFKNGYKNITDLVDWVNSSGNIRWTSLLNIAEHYLNKKTNITPEHIHSIDKYTNTSTSITLRRFLSEARDNFLQTNNLLSSMYNSIRKKST